MYANVYVGVLMSEVTLLAILATDAIAVPLSPAFPTGELQYILDNSGAKVLLASKKYAAKAREVLDAGLEIEPVLDIKEKITVGGRVSEGVELEGLSQSRGGMMLYTSGTTSRPVCSRSGTWLPDCRN